MNRKSIPCILLIIISLGAKCQILPSYYGVLTRKINYNNLYNISQFDTTNLLAFFQPNQLASPASWVGSNLRSVPVLNTMTISSGTAPVVNGINGYYTFDSTHDFLLPLTGATPLTNPSNYATYTLNQNVNFSISVIFKVPTTLPGTATLVALESGTSNPNQGVSGGVFALGLNTSKQLAFDYNTAGGQVYLTTSNTYLDGNWHHVTITISFVGGFSAQFAMYVDGNLVPNSGGAIGLQTISGSTAYCYIGTNSIITIGGYKEWYVGARDSYFRGTIGPILFYNKVLSAAQVQYNYTYFHSIY